MEHWTTEAGSDQLMRQWLTDRNDPECAALHSERVAQLGASLAGAMGIEDVVWIDSLTVACSVHDIGKLALPQEILKKPDRLSDEEWAVVRQHPEWGARVVERLGMSGEVKAAVRHHHERWDGTGYPDGLAGEAIPLSARVVCVVDVYDALTSHRSYRPAMSRDQALQVMSDEAGSTLDPHIFRVFRRTVLASDAEAEAA